jgi:2-oxoglutarate ferredoxin oxidoreductase subunit alpha
VPGTPGLEHRIGGLEKAALTGNVSYDPDNHEMMTLAREAKIAGIANDIPEVEVFGDQDADLLVVSWGSTFGGVRAGVNNANSTGYPAAHVHIRYLNPLPRNLGDVLRSYKKILVPELNRGQLAYVLRAEYVVPTVTLSKVQGAPFMSGEITKKIIEMTEDQS